MWHADTLTVERKQPHASTSRKKQSTPVSIHITITVDKQNLKTELLASNSPAKVQIEIPAKPRAKTEKEF